MYDHVGSSPCLLHRMVQLLLGKLGAVAVRAHESIMGNGGFLFDRFKDTPLLQNGCSDGGECNTSTQLMHRIRVRTQWRKVGAERAFEPTSVISAAFSRIFTSWPVLLIPMATASPASPQPMIRNLCLEGGKTGSDAALTSVTTFISALLDSEIFPQVYSITAKEPWVNVHVKNRLKAAKGQTWKRGCKQACFWK